MNTMLDNGIQRLEDCFLYAGSTEELSIDVFNLNGSDIELSGFVIELVLTPTSFKYAEPILKKTATIVEVGGLYNRAVVELLDTDTINLTQKCIQQWQVTDTDNKKYVLAQGYITFVRNIDR